MREIFADQIELNGLTMLANKRAILDQQLSQTRDGIQTLMRAQHNGVAEAPMLTATAKASDPTAIDEGAGSIVNRSPVTNYHIYPATQPVPMPAVPTPTPAPVQSSTRKLPSWWPWLLTIPLLGGLAAAWYFWPKPTQPPAETLTPGASKIGISVTPGS